MSVGGNGLGDYAHHAVGGAGVWWMKLVCGIWSQRVVVIGYRVWLVVKVGTVKDSGKMRRVGDVGMIWSDGNKC